MLANLLTYLNVSPATPPEPGMTTMYFNAEDSLFSVVVVPLPLLVSFVLLCVLLLLLLLSTLLLTLLPPPPFELSLLLFSANDVEAEVVIGSEGALVTTSCIAFNTT
jgi:hypothetical protein